MTWWEWALLGLAIWTLLLWAVCVANYRFWSLVSAISPPVCSGCQRHFVISGCPVHDSQEWRP